jgi:NAD(P)-dependent dehydrogenase (short-subunit alcohol dehydrogenase family)
MSRFEDKVVLITGAASGIGKASAERIASEGGTVICVDLNAESLQLVVEGIRLAGGVADALVCDITDQSQVTATVSAVIEKHGKLDALCNIAGILEFGHSHEVKMADFDRVMKVNCYGLFMMCQAAIPHLLNSKGYIVNASSSAALGAHAWTAAYSASKGAVLALTKCLANEYSLRGLNCNAICPGGIATPMVKGVQLPEGIDRRILNKASLPDHYFAPPEDVAGVVAFLASEDARFINGDHIRVDGGLLS